MATSGLISLLLGGRRQDGSWAVGGIFREIAEECRERGVALIPQPEPGMRYSPHGWYLGLHVGIPVDPDGLARYLDVKLADAGVDVLLATQAVRGRARGRPAHARRSPQQERPQRRRVRRRGRRHGRRRRGRARRLPVREGAPRGRPDDARHARRPRRQRRPGRAQRLHPRARHAALPRADPRVARGGRLALRHGDLHLRPARREGRHAAEHLAPVRHRRHGRPIGDERAAARTRGGRGAAGHRAATVPRVRATRG